MTGEVFTSRKLSRGVFDHGENCGPEVSDGGRRRGVRMRKCVVRRIDAQEGVIMILSSLLLFLFVALAALAVDVSLEVQRRQWFTNTLDAAVLAGASQLPADGPAAEALVTQFALDNDTDLTAADIDVSFRCVVGDRDGDGQPDAEDIPAACDPGSNTAPPFVCSNGLCAAPCDPAAGDECNTVVVSGTKTVDYAFASVMGISEGSTTVLAAACVGLCGSSPTGPVDMALILDRTGSMSASDLANAKDAVLAVLNFLDPGRQHVSLLVLGAAHPSDLCQDRDPSTGGNWLAVPLSNDFKDNPDLDVDGDGVPDLDSSSAIVETVGCLQTSSQGTNLGSPISDDAFGRPDAMTHLLTAGRLGVKKGIILLSDGKATQPTAFTNNPCRYAFDMAQKAKNAQIEIFTIGFGVEGGGNQCADNVAPYNNVPVTQLLADMATQPSVDNCAAGSTELENIDGDHFFCEPKTDSLKEVFLTVAARLVSSGSKLVRLPPGA